MNVSQHAGTDVILWLGKDAAFASARSSSSCSCCGTDDSSGCFMLLPMAPCHAAEQASQLAMLGRIFMPGIVTKLVSKYHQYGRTITFYPAPSPVIAIHGCCRNHAVLPEGHIIRSPISGQGASGRRRPGYLSVDDGAAGGSWRENTVRGYSFFGDSFVYVLFDDSTTCTGVALTSRRILLIRCQSPACHQGFAPNSGRMHWVRLGVF